jgi:hypothetical protein
MERATIVYFFDCDRWKLAFDSAGLAALKSSYQGGKGYLNGGERQAVIEVLANILVKLAPT